MLTDSAKRIMLEALKEAVVEAGWGTGSSPNATALTSPTYTQALAKRVEGGTLIVEYVVSLASGSKTLREVALFGRDQNGNRLLLFRSVRDPVNVTPPLVIRDRVEIRVE